MEEGKLVYLAYTLLALVTIGIVTLRVYLPKKDRLERLSFLISENRLSML